MNSSNRPLHSPTPSKRAVEVLRRPPERQITTAAVKMTTTATPRRRDRAPLSSVDSNVVGSLRKKYATSRSPLAKQQKRFSTKTTKTPGTKRKKRRQKKKNLTIDTPRIESPLYEHQTLCHDEPAEAALSKNVTAIPATDASSTTQLSEHVTKFTFGSSGIFYDSQQWEEEQSAAFKSWLNHLFHPSPEIDTVGEEQRSAELNAAMKLFNSRRMSAIRFAIEREVTEGRLAITPRAGRNILDEVYVQEQLSTLLLSYTPRWLQLGLEVVLAHHGDQRRVLQYHDMSKETLKKIILEQVLSKSSAVQKYTAGTASGYFEQMLRVEIQQHTLSVLLILVFFLDEAKTRDLLTGDPVLFEKTSQVKSSQDMLISLCQDCFAKQRSILNHLEYEGISVSHVQEPLDEYNFRVRNFAVDLKDGVCLAKMMNIVTKGCNILSSLRLPADSRKHKMYNVRLALAALRQLGVPNISDITPAHVVDAHQPRIIQLVWSTILYFELPEFRQEIIQYKASRLIQGQARRFLAMKSYHIALRGCVSLQSLVRGVRLRTRVIEMSTAAREIQKIWRGYDAKVRYGFELLDIITVQSVVRRFLACKRVTLLSKRRHASIQIQKVWRGYDQKIQYGFVLLDIIRVQSVFRRFLDVRRANARLNGIVKIQSATRTWTAKRTVARYQNAVVTIQSSIRKSLAMKHATRQRKEIVEMDMDSIEVDSVSQSHINDDDSEEEEGEVIYYSTNQARRRDETVSLIRNAEYEAECSIDEQIDESTFDEVEEDLASISTRYSSMSEDLEFEHELASMIIQRHWRRHFSSARYVTTRKAIIACQSICRRWVAQKKTHTLRVARSREELASIKVTSFCRGYFTRIKYLKTLAATTTIQKIARGYIAKKIVEETRCFQIFLTWDSSAKKIQAQFRRHVCESMYNTVLTGVVLLQARIRRNNAMKTFNDLMIARAQAATLIQKTYRSFCASSTFLVQKRAASIIQSAFRRHFFELKYRALTRASVLIQAKCRSKTIRESFLLHLKCVRILQRAGRKFLADMKMKQVAATNIQRIWRGYSANVDFMLLVLAAIKIQSVARMRSAFTTYNNILDGIILTQACFRSKQSRKTISSQQCSSIVLQKIARGFLVRIHKKVQLAAVATIQRAVRETIVRSRKEFCSCIIIQTAARGFLARMYRKKKLAAAVIIQRAAREMMTRSNNKVKKFAATEIQRIWRGFSAHIDFMIQVMAAMKIQAGFRELRAKRALLVHSSQRKSSTIIQKIGRGFLARVQKERALSAVTVIQRAAREMISRSHDDLVRNFAASEIQRIWRGFSAHVDFMLQVMAAMRIQTSIRCYLKKKTLYRTARMAKMLQENDLVEDSFVKEASKTKPQTHQKQERRIESFPKILSESPEMNQDPPPRVIDAIACTSNSKQEVKHVSIPKIITTASYIATSNKIHVRSLSKYEKHTAKAIKVLRKSELFSEVMEAVSILEKTTSKSIDSCKLLLKARGQDNLLSLLASCNRSSPHLELVRVILHIFKNITGHQASLSVLGTREYMSKMTDVVQMFRDKADIFELSTLLLETFVRSDAFILSEHSSHEQRRCLREVLSLSRKRASVRSCPGFDRGILYLENVMNIVEGGTIIESKPKCPYCDREFT
eukprot:scaffold24849_cov104-Skeletonema_dohrnii-CCMP3373.AAC.2